MAFMYIASYSHCMMGVMINFVNYYVKAIINAQLAIVCVCACVSECECVYIWLIFYRLLYEVYSYSYLPHPYNL